MSRISLTSLFSLAALGAALTLPMGATTVVVTPGLLTSPVSSGVTTTNFNSGLVPSNFVFTGNSGIVSGTSVGNYVQPANDPTDYAYVGSGGSITESLGAGGVNYFGLYWGSGDVYNSITFTDTMGNKVIYGSGGIAIPTFTAYQNNPDSYVQFYVTGNNWVSATFASVSPAFEFDNVSAGVITPEPASLTLLSLGFLAVGAGVARRRKSA